jgi:hypothetical protein
MPTNFIRDIRESIRNRLVELGIDVDPFDHRPIEIVYFAAMLRQIAQRPRRVHLARNFKIPMRLSSPFAKLRILIEHGDDLVPFQSRRTKFSWDNDGLLNDWGVQHLHLDSSGTKDVVMGAFHANDAYLIAIMPHGRGHKEVWAEERLIRTMKQNWPQLLQPFATLLKPVRKEFPRPTPMERIEARRCGVQPLFDIDGVGYVSPGGGIAIDGTNPRAVKLADDCIRFVEQQEAHANSRFEFLVELVTKAGHTLPDEVHLRMGVTPKGYSIFVNGTDLELPIDATRYG